MVFHCFRDAIGSSPISPIIPRKRIPSIITSDITHNSPELNSSIILQCYRWQFSHPRQHGLFIWHIEPQGDLRTMSIPSRLSPRYLW
jgi:hypothetical protein